MKDFLIPCGCAFCENCDCNDLGLTCMLCNPQFTEDGHCADFVGKIVVDGLESCTYDEEGNLW